MMNREDTLIALLQATIHRQANPDRVGCPTVQSLEAFLRGQVERGVAEGICDHLPQCRECLLELKTLREITWEEVWESETQMVGVG